VADARRKSGVGERPDRRHLREWVTTVEKPELFTLAHIATDSYSRRPHRSLLVEVPTTTYGDRRAWIREEPTSASMSAGQGSFSGTTGSAPRTWQHRPAQLNCASGGFLSVRSIQTDPTGSILAPLFRMSACTPGVPPFWGVRRFSHCRRCCRRGCCLPRRKAVVRNEKVRGSNPLSSTRQTLSESVTRRHHAQCPAVSDDPGT